MRALKDPLSEYLRRVQAGEQIRVTSPGRVILRLDTSTFLKLYLDETGSRPVRDFVTGAAAAERIHENIPGDSDFGIAALDAARRTAVASLGTKVLG